jgi:hypothetical protein
VRFTLRAYIVDNTTRRVLAWREFDETFAAASEDPYGGVVAANRAVQSVLEQLASFCAEAAANWHPPGKLSRPKSRNAEKEAVRAKKLRCLGGYWSSKSNRRRDITMADPWNLKGKSNDRH